MLNSAQCWSPAFSAQAAASSAPPLASLHPSPTAAMPPLHAVARATMQSAVVHRADSVSCSAALANCRGGGRKAPAATCMGAVDVHRCNAGRSNSASSCSSCHAAIVPAAAPANFTTAGTVKHQHRHGAAVSLVVRGSGGGSSVTTVQESSASTASGENGSNVDKSALELVAASSNLAVGTAAGAAASIESNGSAAHDGRRSAHYDEQQYGHHHPSAFIGFGKGLEDRSFRERFVVRFSEAGPRGTINIETLSSLLQEAATNHVINIDYVFSPGRNHGDQIAVVTRMHMEVDQYPAWRDLLEVDTWFQREGKNAVRRDWILRDVKTGRQLAFATSTWCLMNTLTRRLTKMTDKQWTELEPFMCHPPRWALSEERRIGSATKIPKLEDSASYKTSGLVATDKDTDINQHVNNIRYMTWMLESVPESVKNTHELSKITLEYRQEASQGQPVESIAEAEEYSGDDACTTPSFMHLITAVESRKEINRGRTVWRALQ